MDNASGEESKDDDNDSDTPMARWNLRRASAAGLDRLSLTYHDELLPVLLPIVQQRLQVGLSYVDNIHPRVGYKFRSAPVRLTGMLLSLRDHSARHG